MENEDKKKKEEIIKDFLNERRSSLEWEQVNEMLKKDEEEKKDRACN